MAPYTRASALSAGWVWQIPLDHRIGNGYVYSSRFIGEEAAALEMASHLGVPLDTLQPRGLRMRVGRRTKFWQGNCIAVGLSSGFVEPIESTGIFIIQRGLALLLTYFPDLAFEPQLARRYNERMAATYDEIRDFIVAHYALNQRPGSPFWAACRDMALPSSLLETLEAYDRTGTVEVVEHAMFPPTSWYCILTGQRRMPRRYHPGADLSDFSQVRSILESLRASHARAAQSLPPHRAYIDMLQGRDPARARLEGASALDAAATAGIG
jgi:tryptophan 7-halogenase